MYGLVDCNNFYVSCERVFNPLLRNKPVIVLSNNDGCIIARSNEAKSLGIPMGAPLHLYKTLIKNNKIFTYSSNYTLYGDMSSRVMTSLNYFTPAAGPRIMINAKNSEQKKIFELIIKTFEMIVGNNNLSSAHINFTTDNFNKRLQNDNWIRRTGLQFHWHNNNYETFDDFLNQLKSSKRKAIKNERKKIKNTNLVIQKLTGEQLTDKIWDSFYSFYLNTIDKKWGGAYLTKEFFYLLNETMRNDILLIIAKQDEKVIAGALNFVSKNTLYGRNWGSIVDIPFLHFELCYYQAIEYAIEKKIKIVEAGAQGHHKIQRGYIAKPTYSNHYLANDSFAKAVKNFTRLEEIEIKKQIEFINTKNSPYSNV